MSSRWRTTLSVALAALALTACASYQRAEWKVLAADPTPSAGFLQQPEKLTDSPALTAFDRMWSDSQTDWRHFTKLYVAPIDTSHTLPVGLWDKINIRHSKVAERDLAVQGEELRERIEDAFRDDPEKHFVVLDDPRDIDGDTAILNLSLVELVPNKAILGVIGLAAWGAPLEIGIPVATLTAFIARGSIAMEGEMRDGGTGEVLAMFADRETGKMRIIDLRSLTWYGNAHEMMNDWANALVEIANTPPEHKPPRHSSLFTVMPW